MSDYPASIAEINIDAVQLNPDVVQAVQRFARSRPWRGTLGERKIKCRRAIRNICRAAGATPPRVIFQINEHEDSGLSCYMHGANVIILRGRLSVVTALHEIGHLLLGHSEHDACAWSLAYFKTAFPQSWERLSFDGHMAIAQRRVGP